MYLPEHFAETDLQRISALVQGYPFGMLVTAPEGIPFVSHLPFIYEPEAEPKGRLIGHMARANPQWRHLSAGGDLLTVFQGPHAYISPTWYASPGVPTWNYAVVHLRGRARLVEGEHELEALVERLTQVHEAGRDTPWSPALTGERRSRLLGAIVGFEIQVTEIQAKFKLSQNRPNEDQQRVALALSRSPDAMGRAVADLMPQHTRPKPS